MSIMTEKGSLDYGIEYPAGSGQYHYDFELRLATVDDNISAYEHPSILGGGVSNMRVNAAIISSCLLSLGTVPKEEITPELIGTAIDVDYDQLYAVQELLKKKRKERKPTSATSDSPSSSSDPAGSAKSESGA
ncbi:hypothetical protein AQ910_29085 [Burkholderia pseudomallei]|uniref:hypothetical protein n=2 Tax=Burkholderia pseudomallei TaxID=28450 RepID=UPI00057231F6|nr:hypothetical protein [Burkholderia pseudomallei]AJX23488.1 hypothetical protein BG17_718 [Burkholderia pseudomallei MSHR491]ONC08421.1 hypothetical protein AQ910_29085 [Burkholderia pseudomallei]